MKDNVKTPSQMQTKKLGVELEDLELANLSDSVLYISVTLFLLST
jgi:hypothetical protein